MDLERSENGRLHFTLGAVERWVIGVVMAGFVSCCYWFVTGVTEKLDTLTTQQAVTNAQLISLSSQLTDVPAIRSQLADHDVRIKRAEQDISELRQMRGLK